MSARELVFEHVGHRYSVDGAPLPSVSRVLEPLSVWLEYIKGGAGTGGGIVDRDVLRAKAALGTAAHYAIELDIGGELDRDSLHPAVLPYFEAWERFKREAHYIARASEFRVWHPAHQYAGTLDSAGWLDHAAALIDFKCTLDVSPTVGPQTAAYREALIATPGVDGSLRALAQNARRWCLQLRPDGTYRMLALEDPNDWRVFLALLTIHHFKTLHAKHYDGPV
jgi:hypothetical protein